MITEFGRNYSSYIARMHVRLERLINLIVNRDYWEIIDVRTIILMSIS